ncbi:hydantoinase B/oxoprolinase family protein [Salinisphaera sp.]|uniref:hydantoinase B/oxoprolinase family protein n=1 Tax=Salinisphaera sp. TaxID=1914330 RepID=UPI002D764FE3|nr:hydantoinase B/oxoprolinase family protein [Salinisphaera sp.]HET7314314.1 hydantoinase B/oxoprolinase family protein [Salinisphaera sp.]
MSDSPQTLDAITLSIMARALAGIAEEMGAVLIRGAYSSNIKERRDCSAALTDAAGRMICQAEHIPVHLGAMQDSVAAVIERGPVPGDVFMLNDPFAGGNHLPDITLVSPITLADDDAHDKEIVAYAVTRAHHSDIGGMRPGSMPADSREIYQEGLVIPPVRLVAAGRDNDEILSILLANVRTPDVRRGDLRAQLAANRRASLRLAELAEQRGRDTLLAAFTGVLTYTERWTRRVIADLPDGVYRAESEIEGDGVTTDDIPISVAVTVDGDQLHVDFTGTADAVAGNVNCPLTVTRAACYFALRTLLPADVPGNAGAYAPISLHARQGSFVNAQRPSAVVAGNVETSQRLTDTVLLALGQATEVVAGGQGTMNNLIIGGADWSYYETLGGGQGASRVGPGTSGRHVGMTNTLNTPIEAFELEYPMRVVRYELAYETGGDGQHRGGDGFYRDIEVLAPATLSLISDRRRHGPRGRNGGDDGTPGENRLNDEILPAKASRELEPGDIVSVRTPGGGGWGRRET